MSSYAPSLDCVVKMLIMMCCRYGKVLTTEERDAPVLTKKDKTDSGVHGGTGSSKRRKLAA